MGITKEQIWAAADEIQLLGNVPTLAAVRQMLGETGSFSTIAPAMADWRAQQTKTTDIKTPIPEAFSVRVRQLAEHVWGEALGVADELVSGERDALRAARRELETERGEMASLLDNATAQISAAMLRQHELESRNDELAALHASAKAEIAGTSARLDEREQALSFERSERQAAQTALSDARERLAVLEAEHQAQSADR